MTPTAVTTARACAAVQAACAVLPGLLSLAAAVAAHHHDVVAARRGTPDEFAGLGTSLALLTAVMCCVPAVLLGLPALLLHRFPRGARDTLLVVESLQLLLVLPRLIANGGPPSLLTVIALAWLALCGATVAGLCTPAARAWAASAARPRPAR